MIILAVGGALIGLNIVLGWLNSRSKQFGRRAEEYLWFERCYLASIPDDMQWASTLRKRAENTNDEHLAARCLQRAEEFTLDAIEHERLGDYYCRMRRKYERAASYPWLPVEPDPPEPK